LITDKRTGNTMEYADKELEKAMSFESESLNEADEDSTQSDYYDFSEDLWNKLPMEVKVSLNDAWDNNKTNTNFFEPYLKALVDAKVITEDEKAEFIKSNDSYGYNESLKESGASGKALSREQLCKKWNCSNEDFEAMCAEGAGNSSEP